MSLDVTYDVIVIHIKGCAGVSARGMDAPGGSIAGIGSDIVEVSVPFARDGLPDKDLTCFVELCRGSASCSGYRLVKGT